MECRSGPPTVLTEHEEDELVSYCVNMADMGFGLSRSDVMVVAFEIAEASGRKHPFTDGAAGRAWYDGFRPRHPQLTLRSTQSLSHARASCANLEIISDYFGKLAAVCAKLNVLMKPMIPTEDPLTCASGSSQPLPTVSSNCGESTSSSLSEILALPKPLAPKKKGRKPTVNAKASYITDPEVLDDLKQQKNEKEAKEQEKAMKRLEKEKIRKREKERKKGREREEEARAREGERKKEERTREEEGRAKKGT